MLTFDTHRVAWVLGFLGLTPFLVGAVGVLAGFHSPTLEPLNVFITYSAVILSFLSGSLWANAGHQGMSREAALTMILSNVFCLTAWLALLLHNNLSAVLLLLVAFPLLCVAEGRVKENLPPSYMRLRTILTWVVFVTHLAVAIALV